MPPALEPGYFYLHGGSQLIFIVYSMVIVGAVD